MSPDGKLLAYWEPSWISRSGNEPYLGIFDATTLASVTCSDKTGPHLIDYDLVGFSNDSQSIYLQSAIWNVEKRETSSVQVVQLSAANVREQRSARTFTNSLGGFRIACDSSGIPWFANDTATGFRISENRQGGGRSFEIVADKGYQAFVLVLRDEVIAFASVYGLDRDLYLQLASVGTEGTQPRKTQINSNSLVTNARAAPDERVAVAICESTSTFELTVGNIERRRAIVIDTRSLRELATVDISKSTGSFDVAVWHGSGVVRIATTAASDKIELQSFSATDQQAAP